MKKLQFKTRTIDKEKLTEILVDDNNLRSFFIKNDLDSNFIEENLSTLFNFKIENDRCVECEGLHACTQDVTGYQAALKFEDGTIRTTYHECNYYSSRKEKQTQKSLMNALYMPKMIYEARLDDYDFARGKNRTLIHSKITNFITFYLNGEKVKGLYLWGEYQKGKTYTLAALANELSKKGVNVILAYFPDLVREFKSRIGVNTVEELISKLKQVEILMLDDIGGESQSVWIRDEVLGPILQHRLLDEKPTFFTSNVSQKDLMSLMTTNSQSQETLKAGRIYARITSISDEYKM